MRSSSLLSIRSGTLSWSGHRRSATYYIVCTNIIKPTTIKLMCIYIELNCQIFTHLNIELLDTVLTKHTEHTFARGLSRNLNNIIL